MTNANPPIEVSVERDAGGAIKHARIRFGPHFATEVRDEDGRVTFSLVYTHHGVEVDASQLDGGLEQLIKEIRALHPRLAVD
jgi:hypothetical protein